MAAPGISWIDRQPIWVVLLLAFAIAAPLTFCFMLLVEHKQNVWENAPCSHFSDYRLGDMPARCIKEFQK